MAAKGRPLLRQQGAGAPALEQRALFPLDTRQAYLRGFGRSRSRLILRTAMIGREQCGFELRHIRNLYAIVPNKIGQAHDAGLYLRMRSRIRAFLFLYIDIAGSVELLPNLGRGEQNIERVDIPPVRNQTIPRRLLRGYRNDQDDGAQDYGKKHGCVGSPLWRQGHAVVPFDLVLRIKPLRIRAHHSPR
ncbi:hypothetical protein ACSBM8_11220 [Sphingomonas sp. ASY06-1R]|uniref:hypothetical protein n=1 Tax=Sphingomonas sp. ASY06-1R TaxID=3445771 RepID=UPI003FA1E48E